MARFKAAVEDFSLFIDNGRMHPRSGVVKLYEEAPEQVESLFTDVLFADDEEDVELRQNNMALFIDEMEKLREKYYPAN